MKKQKFAFVCSPFGGNIERNIRYARDCCKVVRAMGYVPVAPHLYYPQFLNDSDPNERQLGLELGRHWMKEKCSACFVFSKYGISDGMMGDIEFAQNNNIAIDYME